MSEQTPSLLTAYWLNIWQSMKDDPECQARYQADIDAAKRWLDHCQRLDALVNLLDGFAAVAYREYKGLHMGSYYEGKSDAYDRAVQELSKIMKETPDVGTSGD